MKRGHEFEPMTLYFAPLSEQTFGRPGDDGPPDVATTLTARREGTDKGVRSP